MKKLFIILLSALSLTAFAKDVVIALLQPLTVEGSTACDQFEVSMVRGELRKELGRHPGYQVVTRLDVDAILKEMGFQQSGMVNDAQRKKVGDMTGAQYICVSTITRYSTQLYIEAYLVNIETGQMNNPVTQYAKIINDDYSTVRTSCNAMASEMLGDISGHSGKQVGETAKRQGNSTSRDYVENAFGINMKMIWVEGGEFMMGATKEQESNMYNENPVHQVVLDGFYIGKLEVTQSQWEKVMGTNINQQKKDGLYGIGSEYPMYYISWNEAKEFCRLLSSKTGKTYTLPTEAQWEYAARGGNRPDEKKYAGSNIIEEVAWYSNNSGGDTHSCGTKQANSLGIYDMSGNLSEWCEDWWVERYNSYKEDNPKGPSSGDFRVTRGGSYQDDSSISCRVAGRSNARPEYRFNSIGFRVVCIPNNTSAESNRQTSFSDKDDMRKKLLSCGYVDLCLPSGALWKAQSEDCGLITYDKAYNFYANSLPTKEQWEELKDNCLWIWTGNGYKVKGKNGESITMSAWGQYYDGSAKGVGVWGAYWSSTTSYPDDVWWLFFNTKRVVTSPNGYRHTSGKSVHLVK